MRRDIGMINISERLLTLPPSLIPFYREKHKLYTLINISFTLFFFEDFINYEGSFYSAIYSPGKFNSHKINLVDNEFYKEEYNTNIIYGYDISYNNLDTEEDYFFFCISFYYQQLKYNVIQFNSIFHTEPFSDEQMTTLYNHYNKDVAR